MTLSGTTIFSGVWLSEAGSGNKSLIVFSRIDNNQQMKVRIQSIIRKYIKNEIGEVVSVVNSY